jgi:N-acetylglucosamine-6-phosphate deacetylase
MLYLQPARLLTPHQEIQGGAVLVDGDRIAAVGAAVDVPRPPQAQTLDAGGLILSPGFIDLQLNGAFGLDFTADPASLWEVAARLPQHGVTAFLPTIITSPLETIAAAQDAVGRPPASFRGATPLGLHVEGPFLNPAKRGAHNPAHLRQPEVAAVAAWSPASGVRLVTLAPELPCAMELIQHLHRRGVVVSAGHSLATYDEALAGLAAGLTYGTHLFNAMPALEHRAPGLAAALLTDPRAVVGVIPDGLHLHPAIVRLIWQAKGPAGVNVVTDAMAALGMPPGAYQLGDFTVTVDATSARLNDGRLAGSLLSLDQAVRNLMAFTGCSLGEALSTASAVPARVLGLPDRGRIAPGYIADLVLLTPDLNVAATVVGGKVCYTAIA